MICDWLTFNCAIRIQACKFLSIRTLPTFKIDEETNFTGQTFFCRRNGNRRFYSKTVFSVAILRDTRNIIDNTTNINNNNNNNKHNQPTDRLHNSTSSSLLDREPIKYRVCEAAERSPTTRHFMERHPLQLNKANRSSKPKHTTTCYTSACALYDKVHSRVADFADTLPNARANIVRTAIGRKVEFCLRAGRCWPLGPRRTPSAVHMCSGAS